MLINFFNNILIPTSVLCQQTKCPVAIWNFFISELTATINMKIILYFEVVK